MPKKKHPSLERVDELTEQLVIATSEYLLLKAQNSEQLVLASARIKDLRKLLQVLRKELKSETGNGEKVWQLVNVVVSIVIKYILDKLSDSSNYKLRREQYDQFVAHGTLSEVCNHGHWQNN